MTYAEKLKHPKWQKRRLKIMEASGFTCSGCGSDEKTLHVHHKAYRKGAEPWDYEDDELECLCEDCHKGIHAIRDEISTLMGRLDSARVLRLWGYFVAMLHDPNDAKARPAIDGKNVGQGYADFLGLHEETVLHMVAEKYSIAKMHKAAKLVGWKRDE